MAFLCRFVGGPAEGQALQLERAPILLRVTRDRTGAWDALDQLTDTPRPDEQIFVYRTDGEPSGWVHIARDRRAGGHFMGRLQAYRIFDAAPPQAAVRELASWQSWAREAFAKATATEGQ